MTIRVSEVAMNKMKFQQSKQPKTFNGNEQPRTVGRSKKERIYGSVVEIKGNTMYFELNESLDRFARQTHVEPADDVYFIRFMSDRTTATLEHRALEYVNNQSIAHFFFPNIGTANNWPVNKTHSSSYTDQP